MTTDSETTEQYLTFVRSRFLIYVLVFVSRDFELGTAWHWRLFTYWERFPILATFRQIQEVRWRRLRTDVTTNLEGSQISEESTAVPYGANFFKNSLRITVKVICCSSYLSARFAMHNKRITISNQYIYIYMKWYSFRDRCTLYIEQKWTSPKMLMLIISKTPVPRF